MADMPHLFEGQYGGCGRCLRSRLDHQLDILFMREAVASYFGSAKEAQDLPLEDLEDIFKLVSNESVSEEG